jgi:hypothetical protein
MTTEHEDRQSQALLDLRADLRRLHIEAGEPSVRAMAASIGDVSHSTIQAALRGKTLPKWPILKEIVQFLNGDVRYFKSLWLDARESEDAFTSKKSDPARRTVFLSWSGGTSKELARVLGSWLPLIIQNIQIYSSDEYLGSGRRWAEKMREIEDSDLGVICVTPDNTHSPWMAFEAGAISHREHSRAIPVLFAISQYELTGPIASFHALSSDKAGFYELIKRINEIAHVGRLPEDTLRRIFEAMWPQLESALIEVQKDVSREIHPVRRSMEDMLKELVETVRRLDRNVSEETRTAGAEEQTEGRTRLEY